MNWKQLLSNLRFSKTGPLSLEAPIEEEFRSAFEADFDRVVYSTPFRRLARKTQVHPMALNDHIHTRLTHSLEVASVGRSLGHRFARFLKEKNHLPQTVTEQDILWIIQAACLAHDIGNPPFGHAGEFALREWISNHENEVTEGFSGQTDIGVLADLSLFEGNAQGFRLAARGDNSQTGYMRLTIATLGAMIKYPWDSRDSKATNTGKYNVFSTEMEHFDIMCKHMELRRDDGSYSRHPLSFLTEGADDICYRILDIEDAVEMLIIPESAVRDIYCKIAKVKPDISTPLGLLRGQAIRALLNGIWKVFEDDYDNIHNGMRMDDLKSNLPAALTEPLSEIKNLYETIYAERSKIASELGALNALGRIVSLLCRAAARLAEKKNFNETDFMTKRCLELAWTRHYATANQKQTYGWWLHQIIDYVSGLTDNYARQLSREIEGI